MLVYQRVNPRAFRPFFPSEKSHAVAGKSHLGPGSSFFQRRDLEWEEMETMIFWYLME